MRKKAFTLIELIAVLVILAILALIVTPLVMNIIRKARVAADRRSIDAYGRSVELAIANYLLDNGDFPEDISELTIEYKGDEVVCSTTQLNSDSSIYLSGCTVAGRSVDYTYGKESNITYDAYEIGDEITYNGVDFYVIKDSGVNNSSVTMLKAEPIRSSDVAQYVSSSEISSKVKLESPYVQLAYYTSDNCKSAGGNSGCSIDFSVSDIKQIIDIWKNHSLNPDDLVVDSTGYDARLLTYDEIFNNLGYSVDYSTKLSDVNYYYINPDSTPDWVYNSNYYYWTMSEVDDQDFSVLMVRKNGDVGASTIFACDKVYFQDGDYTVRPVITIKKSADIGKNN